MHTFEKLLGFSTAEKRVWSTLSNKGKSVAIIAKEAHLPRTTTHKAIQRFVQRGLAKKVRRQKHFLYMARESNELYRELFTFETAPLGSIHLPLDDRTTIKTYRGINVMLEKLTDLAVTHKSERWYLFQSNQSAINILKKIPLATIKALNTSIFRNKQITELFIEENYLRHIQTTMSGRDFREWLQSLRRMSIVYMIPREYFQSSSDLMIFKESAYILDWEKEVMFEIVHGPTQVLMKNLLHALSHFGNKTDVFRMIEQHSKKS